jgi:2-amino-4-hydroxy-6-hydroxymethyldihydropteridine diphosphokinase
MIIAAPWTHWRPAYVGIGSNLEDPAGQVRRALAALAALPATRLVRASSLYRSEPLGITPQPQYVNAVAALLTQQELPVFFEGLRALERQLGRQPPRQRWGPRIIDLDLLMFSQLSHASADLTLPHPGIVQRNFVLYPLREVAPELHVPGSGRVAWLADRADRSGIWRLNDEATTTHGA